MESTKSKKPPVLSHLVLPVEDIIIHVYSTEPFQKVLLAEYKEKLTGPYLYDTHKPHTTPGQYHLHVYLKNNEIFAINWDGTAHDQSHRKIIPRKVFSALKAKFPDLVLPADRIIESISIEGSPLSPNLAMHFDTDELVGLRRLIVEEVQVAGKAMFPPSSRLAIYQGDHVSRLGMPLLIVVAEYCDNGDAIAESHLVWIRGANCHPKPCSFKVKMRPTDMNNMVASRLECVWSHVFACGRAAVYDQIDNQLAKDKWTLGYPKFEFHEVPFRELIRLWLFKTATREIRAIHKNTAAMTLKANLDPVLKLPQFEQSIDDPIENK